MRNTRKFLVAALILAFMILLPNFVLAADDVFTTEEGAIITKKNEGYSGGNISLSISNLELKEDGNYVWTILDKKEITAETKWNVLGDVDYANNSAKIEISAQIHELRDIMRKTDNVYLYIKEYEAKNEDLQNYVINGYNLDITLHPLCAFTYEKHYNGGIEVDQPSSTWNHSTYNIDNMYYKFEKITDEKLVSEYRNAVANNQSIIDVFPDITVEKVKANKDWTFCDQDVFANTMILEEHLPKEQGAYYLWLKAKDIDSKTVYGCVILEIDGDGPILKEILVKEPGAGTYKAPQTVRIDAFFNEPITASEMPVLSIRFGESPIRELKEGTIENTTRTGRIIYKYNIASDDIGQLMTVDFVGGDVKDMSGNSAKITCLAITGEAIKANVDGIVDNQTDNQDQHNDNTTPDPKPEVKPQPEPETKPEIKPETKPEVKPEPETKPENKPNNDKPKDDTLADKVIPHAGAKSGILVAIMAITILGIVLYKKSEKLREI